MPAVFEYAILRVVPRVERGEFVNAGVVLFSKSLRYLEARIELDMARVRALDPTVDLDGVLAHLEAVQAVCRGGEQAGALSQMSQAERFRWLVSPRSTIVQTSPVHLGQSDNPGAELEDLLTKMVRVQRPG